MDDPVSLAKAKSELAETLSQIPTHWDPHMSLEFMKVAIRSVLAGLVGSNRKILRDKIVELEILLNEMQALRVSAVANETANNRINKNVFLKV